MNLPNILTVSRIVMACIFMMVIFRDGVFYKGMALFLFALASVTDYWDGYLARARNLITRFGKLMDPIADKVLIFAAFISFVQIGLIQAWMVAVMLAREVSITGVRLLAAGGGDVIPAGRSGKHKTVAQMVAAHLILIYLVLIEADLLSANPAAQALIWLQGFMYYVVGLTIFSGFRFALKNKHLWKR